MSVPTIYLTGNPSSNPRIPRQPFQEVVLLFYVEHFNELLRYFLGLHAVSHVVLSDNGLIRPMHIAEVLHRTVFVSLSVAKGHRNKAILNYFILGSIPKLQRNHCKL